MEENIYKLSKHFRLNVPARIKHYATMGASVKAVYGGIDFYEYREYQVGDDIRFIDWNLLARLDKKIIRTFCADYAGSVDIILDTSLSMELGDPPKSYMSEKIALLLYEITRNSNFSISFYTFSDSQIKMYSDYSQFQKLFIKGKLHYGGSTYFNEVIASYMKMKKARVDMVFFISDFHSHDNMQIFFETINRVGKIVVLLEVYSYSEIGDIKSGRIIVEEPETGVRKEIFINNLIKKLLIENYGKFLEFIKRNAVKNGAIPIQIDSKSSLFNLISKLMHLRIIKKEK